RFLPSFFLDVHVNSAINLAFPMSSFIHFPFYSRWFRVKSLIFSTDFHLYRSLLPFYMSDELRASHRLNPLFLPFFFLDFHVNSALNLSFPMFSFIHFPFYSRWFRVKSLIFSTDFH